MRMNSRCGIARKPRQHVLEAVLVERQRVAARDQAVPDGRRGRDVLDGPVDVGLAQRALAARADEPRPRAVAAIDRAEVRDEQQYPVGVAMDEPRHGAVAVLAERVVLLAGRTVELRERRDRRPAQALRRVGRRRSGSCNTASRRSAADPWWRRIAARSSSVTAMMRSSCSRLRMRLRFCHRQSFHSAVLTPGKCRLRNSLLAGLTTKRARAARASCTGCAVAVEFAEIERGLSDKESFGLRQTRRFFLQGLQLAHRWSKGSEPIVDSLPGNSVVTWVGRPSTRNESGVNIKRGS